MNWKLMVRKKSGREHSKWIIMGIWLQIMGWGFMFVSLSRDSIRKGMEAHSGKGDVRCIRQWVRDSKIYNRWRIEGGMLVEWRKPQTEYDARKGMEWNWKLMCILESQGDFRMSWPWRMGMSRGLALLELAESLWASRAATSLSSLPLPACRGIAEGPSTSLKKMNKLPGTSFLF